MTTFFNRSIKKQQLIRKAYEFEIIAIHTDSAKKNPYFDTILSMQDGKAIWEEINIAVEMAFN